MIEPLSIMPRLKDIPLSPNLTDGINNIPIKPLSGFTQANTEPVQNFKQSVNDVGNFLGKYNINGTLDTISGLLPGSQPKNTTESMMDSGYGVASNVADQIVPGAGKIMGAVGALSKITNSLGAGTDGLTGIDNLFNSKIGGLALPLKLINGWGGKKSDTFYNDELAMEQVGGGYMGSTDEFNNAQSKSDKKYGLFSSGARHKANRAIAQAQYKMGQIADIAEDSDREQQRQHHMNAINHNSYMLSANGGYDNSAIRIGKNGMNTSSLHKPNVNWMDVFYTKYPNYVSEETIEEITISENNSNFIDSFKKGGKFNLIPEGAFHSRKHNMEVGDFTKKGIPVIIEEDGGVLEQVAEIERKEIILHRELTKQLEKLAEDGSDEAALEAGKLLVKEILDNTVDNAGLIDEIQV